MKVVCRTNLDLSNEEWPRELPSVPNVGDRIQSATKHGVFQLPLKVVRVTWKRTTDYEGRHTWYPEIELHDAWPEPRSIQQFYEWYAPLVGRSLSAFI